eukprot:14588796-Ditylum_brightwellii.AAC.1
MGGELSSDAASALSSDKNEWLGDNSKCMADSGSACDMGGGVSSDATSALSSDKDEGSGDKCMSEV